MGITDTVFVGVVLLARKTEGASVYGFGGNLRDFPYGWDLFCAVSMCILTSPRFYSSVLCHRYSSTVEGITTQGRRIMIYIVNVSSGGEVVSKS